MARFVDKIETADDERMRYDEWLPKCEEVVEAVGFHRAEIPVLVRKGEDGREVSFGEIGGDHETGALVVKGGERIKGLYGVGIAWPEKVTDPEGNVEYAVGMWKFVNYLKRIVPGWLE